VTVTVTVTGSGTGSVAETVTGQQAEVALGCRILNDMTALGMPDGFVVM